MFLLSIPLKQHGICFSEIGLDCQKMTANYMLTPSLRQLKIAALTFKNIMKIKREWFMIFIEKFSNLLVI